MSFTLTSRIPQLTADMKRRASLLVRATALNVQAHAQASMSGSKRGRQYRRHQASAPGEAPAIDTGTLFNSITVEVAGELSAAVGTNVEHGLHTEFGTSRMEPRPWLAPAMEAVAPEFEAGLKELLK